MNHPEAGPLELWREKLPIGDSGGQLLVIYHAEPGSDSARALERLAVTAIAPVLARPMLTGPEIAVGVNGARSRELRKRG